MVIFGVYTGSESSGIPPPSIELEVFEQDIGKKVDVVGMVAWWYDGFEWGDWNTMHQEWANKIKAHGSIPLILWQAFNPYTTDPYRYTLKSISNGLFDNYIRLWAQQIKAWGHPIILRPFHELNRIGYIMDFPNYQSWSARLVDYDNITLINEPQDVVNAWRHIVDIFRNEKTTNVIWMWSVLSWPSVAYNGTNLVSLKDIYPGDNYVDQVGFSLYHKDFFPLLVGCDDLNIAGIYQELSDVSTKPIVVAEMGAIEKNGDKPKWIRKMLHKLDSGAIVNKLPRVEAIYYWNDARNGLYVESDLYSIEALKEAISDYGKQANNLNMGMMWLLIGLLGLYLFKKA